MTLSPGIIVGVIYPLVMLGATVVLRRTEFFNGSITAKAYLRVTTLLTLVVSIFMIALSEGSVLGAWVILFFMGFQVIAIVTSYLTPEDPRLLAEVQ